MKTLLLLLLCLSFLLSGCVTTKAPRGDEKIKKTIDKIKEEAEKAEEEEEKKDEKKKKVEKKKKEEAEEEEGSPFFDIIFWYLQYASTIRFTDYPYEADADFYYNTSTYVSPQENKIISLQMASDVSYHFDETYGNTNRVTAQLTAVHANFFYQTIFSGSEWFSVVSFNGGISLLLQDFILSSFIGFYKLNFIDDFLLSFGFMSQIFLPANFYIDLYNLNAVLVTVPFTHLAASLNYALWRFSIGVGYNYNKFADIVYAGPCIKVCFWL